MPGQLLAMFIVLTAVGPAMWMFLAGGDPDLASRKDVAAQLAQHEGIRLPLPVRLPAGYEPPDDYSVSVNEDGIAYGRGTRFHPSGEGAPKNAAVVVLCTQGVEAPDRPCDPHPSMRSLERVVDSTVVVIWAEYPPTASLDQWSSLELTTDLNKVRWLH